MAASFEASSICQSCMKRACRKQRDARANTFKRRYGTPRWRARCCPRRHTCLQCCTRRSRPARLRGTRAPYHRTRWSSVMSTWGNSTSHLLEKHESLLVVHVDGGRVHRLLAALRALADQLRTLDARCIANKINAISVCHFKCSLEGIEAVSRSAWLGREILRETHRNHGEALDPAQQRVPGDFIHLFAFFSPFKALDFATPAQSANRLPW
jgi:hypothetical protein